jgi:glutaminyl-peptide cyclotransferase
MTAFVAVFISLLVIAAVGAGAANAPSVPTLEWEVVSRRPHDTTAFTQGLLLDEEGRLFESLGQWGESDVREVDPASGRVLRARPLPDAWFGEGLALVDDELVQLTWKAGLAMRWDKETFEPVRLHHYDGQGWGLCHDGERLVMSDGSDHLAFRDAGSFEVLGGVDVTIEGQPLDDINELECVEDVVWANVWQTDDVYRIDPRDGRVTGVLDLRGLLEPHPATAQAGAVLNGIAWDERAGTFLVTGKYWPELIEINVSEARSAAGPGHRPG